MMQVKKWAVVALSFCSSFAYEHPIVVVIPSRNNIQWCDKNIGSVLNQKYDNYRVIYCDDASDDRTPDRVAELAHMQTQRERVERITLIRNKQRRGALANIYRAVHSCDDRAIIVTLDGDDWFKHDQVLARINEVYQNPQVWMTYGQYEEYPQGKLGHCKEIPAGIVRTASFREYDWVSSHLRTFYAGLFKRIKLQDLMYEGTFFDVTWDMAFMFPMLEMAAERHAFIPDVLYVYNMATPSNDFKTKLIKQIHCRYVISAKHKYQRIAGDLFDTRAPSLEVVVFASSPEATRQVVRQLRKHCRGIQVVYEALRNDIHAEYTELQDHYAGVTCHAYEQHAFKTEFMKLLRSMSQNAYVLLMLDTCVFKNAGDMRMCIDALRATQAHFFSFELGLAKQQDTDVPPHLSLTSMIAAWQFKDGAYAWRRPYGGTGIYRVADLIAVIEQITLPDFSGLQEANAGRFDMEQVGLCCVEALVSKAGDCV